MGFHCVLCEEGSGCTGLLYLRSTYATLPSNPKKIELKSVMRIALIMLPSERDSVYLTSRSGR